MPPTRSLKRTRLDDLIQFNRDSRGDSSFDAINFLERCRDGPKIQIRQHKETSADSRCDADRTNKRKRPKQDTYIGDHVDDVWQKLHYINNLRTILDDSNKDCLFGDYFPQFSYIFPYSEEWIISIMIWLLECGVIDADPDAVERWRANNLNIVPTIPWMGDTMEYQIGGLLFMPTKKCLYRLCLLAQVTLFEYSEEGTDFTASTPKDLNKPWASRIGRAGIEVERAGKYHYLGTKYNTIFEEGDYKKIKLSFGSEYDGKATEVFIYEYHYILTKNQCVVQKHPKTGKEKIIRTADKSQSFMRDLYIPKQQGSKEIDRVTENIHLYPEVGPNGQRPLPQMTEFFRTNLTTKVTESGIHEVGPKLFVPFEPVSAIIVFWATARRLLYDLRENFIAASEEFKEIMQLADLFLKFAQCTSPDQLWEINAAAPECFEDKYTLPYDKAPDDCNRQKRATYRDKIIKQEHLSSDEAASNKCDEVLPFYQPSKYSFSHDNPQASVDALEDCILDICFKKQIQFDEWLKEKRLSEALDRQRQLILGPEDEEVVRLWSELVRVKEHSKHCKGQSFYNLFVKDKQSAAWENPNNTESDAEMGGSDSTYGLISAFVARISTTESLIAQFASLGQSRRVPKSNFIRDKLLEIARYQSIGVAEIDSQADDVLKRFLEIAQTTMKKTQELGVLDVPSREHESEDMSYYYLQEYQEHCIKSLSYEESRQIQEERESRWPELMEWARSVQ